MSITEPSLCHQLGLLTFSGSGVQKFLQGQFTCDVAAVKEGGYCLGAYCNRQGRVQASFYLFLKEGRYWVLLSHTMCAALLQHLTPYARLVKVRLEDISQDHVLKKSCLTRILQQDNASWNDWKYHHIQKGIAQIYPESRALLTPHQLDYPDRDIVSFKKGCYLGQEIIARMEYRGKRKYTCYRASVPLSAYSDGLLKPGAIIMTHDQRKAGYVIDYATQADKVVLLVTLLISSVEAGHVLFLQSEQLQCLEGAVAF